MGIRVSSQGGKLLLEGDGSVCGKNIILFMFKAQLSSSAYTGVEYISGIKILK